MLAYGDDVTVLSMNKAVTYKNFYEKNNIKVIPITFPSIKYIRTLFSGIFNIRKFIGYDMICFHFMSNLALCMLPFAKLCCKKVTASFWGSDIFRRKRKHTSIVRFLLSWADIITLSTPDMVDRFHLFFGNSLDFKIRSTHYGLSTLEVLKKLTATDSTALTASTNSFDSFHEKYKIPKEKVIIAIGYNKGFAQQHLKVLDVINSLPISARQKIHLIFRLTYGDGDAEYINAIKQSVLKSGCTSNFFETFMPDEEIAEITNITDIFIHAQITDARSGSMCEHLYAGCLVLNPSWLPYNELKDKVFFLKYEDFSDLGTVLLENLTKKDVSKYRGKLMTNKEAIYKITSWASCVKEWRNVYLQ